MWTMDCAGDVNEVKAISPLISYASNIANYTTTSTLAPNNSNDSDCTSDAKIIKRPSIFKHLVQPENKSARSLAVQSTRWSPTAEQLMALEELYKHGTRTPTAIQIQDITTKLRRFGKIEGKNVFYWFQNHKARDKKKQRLRLFGAQRQLQFDQQRSYDSKPKHQSVVPKVTSLEVEQTKREPLSNCSTISEESGSVAVPRATTHSRVAQLDVEKDELKKHVSSFNNYPVEIPFCFPMINLNGTSPNALVSLALEHSDSPGLSHVFSNIFGNNNNNYGIIRETSTIQTLELFPLQSGNLKTSATTSQTDHPHEEATKNMPFIGDLSLRLMVIPLEN